MLKAVGLQRIQTKEDKPLAESVSGAQKEGNGASEQKKGKKKGEETWPDEWPFLGRYDPRSECGDGTSGDNLPHSNPRYAVVPEVPKLHQSPAQNIGLSSSTTGQYKRYIPGPKDRRGGPRPVTDPKATAKANAGRKAHTAGGSYMIRQGPGQPRQPALPPAIPTQNVGSSPSSNVINHKIGEWGPEDRRQGGRPTDGSKNAVNAQTGRGGTSGRQPAPPPTVPPSRERRERTPSCAGNPGARRNYSDVGVQTAMEYSDLLGIPGPAKYIRWAEDVAIAVADEDRKAKEDENAA